jgi:uncharacterized DUF497 family protein
VLFEWDESKRRSNLEKHGIDFANSAALFLPGGRMVAALDVRTAYGEERYIGFGLLGGRVVAVCFTYRNHSVRLVSLRKANQREQKKYDKEVCRG